MSNAFIDLYLAPILGLAIGSAILFLVGYTNWHKPTKTKVVGWISTKIYRNSMHSESRAEGLFGVATSLLLATGGLIIVASVFILGSVTR